MAVADVAYSFMSPVQRLVSPKLPTALAGRPSVDLPGYDLSDYMPDGVWVLPTKLDVARFEEALSSALQIYPHAAGRLRRSDGRWFIELTNTPVPVDIVHKPGATADILLNGDWAVQDDLSPFISCEDTSAQSTDENTLLRLKLTFFDGETSIGLSWHHVLGDIFVTFRFMHTLSQFYQGLPLVYPSPTFEKYHFPAPSPTMLAEFWPRLPHLHVTRTISEFGEIFAELLESFRNARWRIGNRDLIELRSVLSSRAQNECRLSQQDCLTAYVVAVLNHNTTAPVQTVMNLANFSDVHAPFIPKDVAANLIENIHTTIPRDMAGIATALRRALVRGRQPDRVHNLMSVTSHLTLEAMNARKYFDMFRGDPTMLFVNSSSGIDTVSVHFGYPNSVQAFTSRMNKLYLRCFRSNPVKGDDGVWRARQSVDISMGVPKELEAGLLETFSRGIQYMVERDPMTSRL